MNELGIYLRDHYNNPITYVCVVRDKLPLGVIIGDTDTGTIQYTLRTNVAT